MKKYHLFAILLFALLGCKSVEPIQKPYVIPVNQQKEPALFYYNLPKTVLEFEITVKQRQSFRGPYYQYGEKYLGLAKEAIIQRNHREFTIEKISSRTITTPDSSQWYAFVHSEQTIPSFVLNSENVLLAFNNGEITRSTKEIFPDFQPPQPIEFEGYFYELGMANMVGEELRTTFQHVKKDTTTVRVPVRETVRIPKNTEELARLAAEFIQKLRNLRFELTAGLYESFPEGKSLQTSIEELYNVERRYLQLFTGYSKDTTYTYRLFITPPAQNEPYTKVLCYFDTEEGLSLINKKIPYRNNNKNQHLVVEIGCPTIPITGEVNFPGGFVYRIPTQCETELYLGNKLLYSAKHFINQRGTLIQLPHEISRNPNIEFLIDEKSGTLYQFQSTQPAIPQKKK